MNLPAHLVVIKSTAQYVHGQGSGTQNISGTSLRQMIGRAGRPQFDTRGVAVVMTHTDTVEAYKRMAHESEPIESWCACVARARCVCGG